MTRGFTLVELLVVITIIVVLLALLAPALDEAVYQAELAVCGSRLKSTGTGVITYTTDFRRRYPYREGVVSNSSWAADWISVRPINSIRTYDDRPMLRPYMSLRTLVCPLAGVIDLDNTQPESMVLSPYKLWFGWKYNGDEAAMFRLGDAWTWSYDSATVRVVNRLTVLAGDYDMIAYASPDAAWSSHPDKDGKMTNQVHRDQTADSVTTLSLIHI